MYIVHCTFLFVHCILYTHYVHVLYVLRMYINSTYTCMCLCNWNTEEVYPQNLHVTYDTYNMCHSTCTCTCSYDLIAIIKIDS